MESALEHTFLLERITPGIARFRVAGRHLTRLMGSEVGGMPLTILLEPAARGAAQALLEALFSGPSIVEMSLEAERGMARPPLEARMLLLPVMGDEGACDKALGCLVTSGQIGRSPRRFAIASQRTETISPYVPEPTVVPAIRPLRLFAFAENGPRFVAQKPDAIPNRSRSRAHLRLVKSNE